MAKLRLESDEQMYVKLTVKPEATVHNSYQAQPGVFIDMDEIGEVASVIVMRVTHITTTPDPTRPHKEDR
jgi:hypothetical protein